MSLEAMGTAVKSTRYSTTCGAEAESGRGALDGLGSDAVPLPEIPCQAEGRTAVGEDLEVAWPTDPDHDDPA